jgi:hypothetical protein
MGKAKAKELRERGKWKRGSRVAVNLTGVVPVPKGSMKAFVPAWKPGQLYRPNATVTDSKSAELKALARDIRDVTLRELTALGLPCAQEQPFELLLCYYLPRPGGHFSKASGEILSSAQATPWSKPDLDKLERATKDALTGLVWDDDSRVVRCVKEKRFSTRTRDVGLWLEARVLPATMRELRDWQQLETNLQGATA